VEIEGEKIRLKETVRSVRREVERGRAAQKGDYGTHERGRWGTGNRMKEAHYLQNARKKGRQQRTGYRGVRNSVKWGKTKSKIMGWS